MSFISKIPRNNSIVRLLHSTSQFSDIKIGDKASITKSFTAKEVETFAEISGDKNPIHLDENFAKTTRYKRPIVHGVLTVGLLSGILGTKLPGQGTVVLSYEAQYPAPLYVDESVTAEVEIKNIQGRKVLCEMKCYTNDNKVVTKGICQLFVPKDKVKK